MVYREFLAVRDLVAFRCLGTHVQVILDRGSLGKNLACQRHLTGRQAHHLEMRRHILVPTQLVDPPVQLLEYFCLISGRVRRAVLTRSLRALHGHH